MSENLKKYRLNIIGSKITLEGIDQAIMLVISIVGVLIAFLPESLPKRIIAIGYLLVVIVLAIIRFFVRQVYKNIEADNKYLDEEILLLKELAYDLENVKNQNSQNFRLLMQLQGFVAALDYVLLCNEKIDAKLGNIDNFKNTMKEAINNVYLSLHNQFEDYQEKITIALYVYSPHTKNYLDYISHKPDTAKTVKGRIWDENDDAHICYVGRKKEHTEFIFNNIMKDLPTPQNKCNWDNEYVSSISIPIFFNNKKDIRAVLSVTSNYATRFDRNSHDNFKNLCNTLLMSYFSSIAKIFEQILNRVFPTSNDILIWDAIAEYKKHRADQITETLDELYQKIKS